MKIVKIIIRSLFSPILFLAMALTALIGCGVTTWEFITGKFNISQWVKQK